MAPSYQHQLFIQICSRVIMTGFNMYIDESYESKASYIAMAGLILSNENWKLINDQVNNLKKEFLNDLDFNLKRIRRGNYEKEGSAWKSFTDEERTDFNNRYFSILEQNQVVIIVSLINKAQMRTKDKQELFNQAYSFLIERFEYFLDERKSYGLIIYDQAKDSPEVKALFKFHKNALLHGIMTHYSYPTLPKGNGKPIDEYIPKPGYRKIERVYENLIFQKDEDNNCLQIADLVANAFAIEYNREKGKFSSKYKQYLRKNEYGEFEGYGLKIFP